MSVGLWKERALRAEDRCKRLENELELLKAAKAAADKPKASVVKKVTKKVTSKAKK